MLDGGTLGRIIKAIRQKNVDEVCRLLREYGEKHEQYKGVSPLHIACAEGSIVAVKFLIEEGNKDINMFCPECMNSPLTIACRNGHINVVKYLLQRPDIEPSKALDSNQTTALEMACYLNWNLDIFKLLLAHEKTNINAISVDDDRNPCATPFTVAIARDQFDMADLLINDPRFRVENVLKRGRTELHDVLLATYTDGKLRFDHIKRLIAVGADPMVRQDMRNYNYNDNCNAIEEARDCGFNEIADYLEAARLNRSNNQYKDLRIRYSSNTDRDWQENPNHIYDTLEGLAEYVQSKRGITV